MATFYFNAAVDDDWQTLGNWWMSYDAETDTYSVPATDLPTSTDSIEVRGNIGSNSGSAPTVVNALFLAFNIISITVTGNCVFSGISYNLGAITGDCTFNDSSGSMMLGTVNGDCTFNDNAFVGASITGNCIFNDSSVVRGAGIITGDCTFNDISQNYGTVTGDATFNNYSMNIGSISGTATFTGQATNGGTAGTFVPASPPQIFFFNAAVDNDWNNLNNWWMNDACTTQATSLPTNIDSVISSATISSNSGSEPTVTNFILNDPAGTSPYLGIDITVTGLCIFNSTANYGNITGDCIFNNASSASVTITGNCTFNGTSANYGAITGNCIFNDTASNLAGQFDPVFAVTGDCTFNDASQNSGNITANCTFNDSSYNNGPITGLCTFNDSSINDGTILGLCTFNGSSSNGGANYMGVVNGDCTFNDNAKNYYIGGFSIWYIGTVNGNCTFSLSSAALHIDQALEKIKTSDSITGTIDFKYEKGINGSSILGIV